MIMLILLQMSLIHGIPLNLLERKFVNSITTDLLNLFHFCNFILSFNLLIFEKVIQIFLVLEINF